MNKATVILIAVIYIASIVLISLFGMRAIIYQEVIPVTRIECTNTTDQNSQVTVQDDGTKIIQVRFTTAGDFSTGVLTGTYIQLSWHVYPDNATTKNVQFVPAENATERVTFFENASGEQTGLVLFSGRATVPVQIMSTDGTRIYASVILWAY